MGFPFLLPARAAQAQRIPPAAAGEIPHAPGSGHFLKKWMPPISCIFTIKKKSQAIIPDFSHI